MIPVCSLRLGVAFSLKLPPPPPSVTHSTSFSNQSATRSLRHRHTLEMYLLLGVVGVRKIPQDRGTMYGNYFFLIMINLKLHINL